MRSGISLRNIIFFFKSPFFLILLLPNIQLIVMPDLKGTGTIRSGL